MRVRRGPFEPRRLRANEFRVSVRHAGHVQVVLLDLNCTSTSTVSAAYGDWLDYPL